MSDLVLRLLVVVAGCWASTKRQDILNKLLANYDSGVSPNFEDDYPTEVTVQIGVLSINSISEKTMDYSVSIILDMRWLDPRLKLKDNATQDRLEVDPKRMDSIWTPDLYFINEKKATLHDITKPNRLLNIYSNGTIVSSMKISMTLNCDMDLENYPMDEQVCSIYLGSYSYSSYNLNYTWDDEPVKSGVATLPRFQVVDVYTNQCSEGEGVDGMIDGNYSCIMASFVLQREMGYYIAQVYLPSILIVCISFISYWIDLDAAAARVSLGLVTALAMITQTSGEKSSVPKVSYIKAIDVWYAACLIFVSTALLEYAFVNSRSRVLKRLKLLKSQAVPQEVTKPKHEPEENNDISERQELRTNRIKRCLIHEPHLVDKIARVVVPIAFVLFNTVYWVYYLPR